ncbi:hypothetical protein OGAPHI_004417 [Ogataea philodendri]|uniref:Uncharacterized protein n=1 Tax=Ogataea philodendri TaxID=1378263 RepID=A0A9P8T4R8_9ASCO|nr:uncharacterized protein OGAPHI_004417 [Ogataea philodendri]KAH3666228.1 hypothetical protein OGAPHI_004417 [Ogataea philodendri]
MLVSRSFKIPVQTFRWVWSSVSKTAITLIRTLSNALNSYDWMYGLIPCTVFTFSFASRSYMKRLSCEAASELAVSNTKTESALISALI